ncbi:MAG: PAS domain-containing protein [Deltaproteobacteria bacterium]|nr:PAS domain-containing protein [Deltaproteobacteria bacterium]
MPGKKGTDGRSDDRLAGALAHTGIDVLLEGLPDAAVIVDLDLMPMAWNSAYAHMSGLRSRRFAEEAENSHCHELLTLGICKTECLARRAASGKRPMRVDEIAAVQAKVKDPAQLTLVVQAIPLTNAANEVYAVLELYRDVTAEAGIQTRYKALLENEKRRAEELERIVEQRTQELRHSLAELQSTQAQLIQAEKLSSLGRLVSGIAHELNNPLNFVYANLDFLDSYVKDLVDYIGELERDGTSARRDLDYMKNDVKKVAGTIREGAERAIRIVKDLRTFSHTGTHTGEAVDLRACIDSVQSLLHHELSRSKVTIDVQLPPQMPMVFANQPQVEQVLINLLTNAAHAMAPAGGIVEIAGREAFDDVCLTLTDNGTGIRAENLSRLFDPFFTTKPVGQGTGLGLSISRSIMLSWGGSIKATNTPGKGACFSLHFQRAATGSGASKR